MGNLNAEPPRLMLDPKIRWGRVLRPELPKARKPGLHDLDLIMDERGIRLRVPSE